ncbi:MAG: hypothetical protein J6B75_09170 [Ruminococcus sp.]|nr:hypothetical protein [Ruminococcus sp.]
MIDTKNPEELAKLIDSLMAGGSGHVNIIADTDSSEVKVNVVNSAEFCGKGACCQPTENSVDYNDQEE